jgi:hypothetical protein
MGVVQHIREGWREIGGHQKKCKNIKIKLLKGVRVKAQQVGS